VLEFESIACLNLLYHDGLAQTFLDILVQGLRKIDFDEQRLEYSKLFTKICFSNLEFPLNDLQSVSKNVCCDLPCYFQKCFMFYGGNFIENEVCYPENIGEIFKSVVEKEIKDVEKIKTQIYENISILNHSKTHQEFIRVLKFLGSFCFWKEFRSFFVDSLGMKSLKRIFDQSPNTDDDLIVLMECFKFVRAFALEPFVLDCVLKSFDKVGYKTQLEMLYTVQQNWALTLLQFRLDFIQIFIKEIVKMDMKLVRLEFLNIFCKLDPFVDHLNQELLTRFLKMLLIDIYLFLEVENDHPVECLIVKQIVKVSSLCFKNLTCRNESITTESEQTKTDQLFDNCSFACRFLLKNELDWLVVY
jgi:hypothetical protein